MEPWISTYAGKQMWPLHPTEEMLDIEDIAHHLAARNRFSGATYTPYSVAQHSALMARHAPEEIKLWCLLHDAGEAYLPDVPAPYKRFVHFNLDGVMCTFDEVEDRILELVASKWGLEWPIPKLVKYWDRKLCWTEKRDLVPPSEHRWGIEYIPPLPHPIIPWEAHRAEKEFLDEWMRLRPSLKEVA